MISLMLYGLIFWASYELLRLQGIHISIRQALLLAVMIMIYSFVLYYLPNVGGIFYILPFLILIISLNFSTKEGVFTRLMLVFCITSILSIQLIAETSNTGEHHSGLIILLLFFITSANDIIQYLSGKLLGRHKLAPIISPNKTIEGALGGIVITGLLLSFVLPKLYDVAWAKAMVIGIFVSILGILGDLSFSFIKRLFKAKDSGTSLPGHGGLLDRIDSLLLTAPGFGLCLSLIS